MKNPPWSRDELILALDLYIRAGKKQLDTSDSRVIELSNILRRLPIYPKQMRTADFRNVQGVSMKLGNFSAVDPSYSGKGLERGSKLDHKIWNEFENKWQELGILAASIRQAAINEEEEEDPFTDNDDEVFFEGILLTRLHKTRERNRKLVERKKQSVLLEKGSLACEVCGFDFGEVYGELGREFAECHHKLPLSQLSSNQTTRLADLAILCANCHRMIHRSKPLLTIEELQAVVAATQSRSSNGQV